MFRHDQITAFIEVLTDHDGFAPFSDAKLSSLRIPESTVVVAEDAEIVGVGAVATHPQSDGTVYSSLETAVLPAMRFPAFEGAVLDSALSLLPRRGTFGVWSNRTTLDTALKGRGFAVQRILDYLRVELPLSISETNRSEVSTTRTFQPTDVSGIIDVNNAAFHDHREASSLSDEDMSRYMAKNWFDPDGIFVVESETLTGFCWTRVHTNGDGEIYRIAVAPEHQGEGEGFALLIAGFDYLADREDVECGALWCDRSNTEAMNLYRSIGMEVQRSNTAFVSS